MMSQDLYVRFDEDQSSLCASLRRVWSSIATCLQARYTGSYSSELLAMLSPLLVCHHYYPDLHCDILNVGVDAVIEG